MRRREFIELCGGAVLFAPLAAGAQEAGRVYRIGVLSLSPRDSPQFVAFFDELRQRGFIEGSNLVPDRQGYGVTAERVDAVAMAIANARPDAIVCAGGPVTMPAVQRATTTIPIVAVAADFQAFTLGISLVRPAGNITGITSLATELDVKRQEVLIELVPDIWRMAALSDPYVEEAGRVQALQDAARSLGVELSTLHARTPEEIARAVEAARAAGAQALNVLASPMFAANRAVIIERVAAARLPAIYQWPEIAVDGGLIAYGAPLTAIYRQLARQLVRILQGARPADLPVEQPTRIELVINLRTAGALGITVPRALLARADEVIE